LESVFNVTAELVLGRALPWCGKDDDDASSGRGTSGASNSFNSASQRASILARADCGPLQESARRTTATT
jgi:hypothetical protein